MKTPGTGASACDAVTGNGTLGQGNDAMESTHAVRVKRAAILSAVVANLLSGAARQAARAVAAELPIDRVVVTATRSEQRLGEAPASVSVIDRREIDEGHPEIDLDEPLTRVPGLLIRNSRNYAQDLRLQIRGFGARAAFGIREIRVLVDGLPETLADGQTQLDNVDLGAIERVEVLRRSSASLYGNASGGVLQLFTSDGPAEPLVEVRALGGSFGTRKYQVRSGGRRGKWNAFAHLARFETSGYREHSRARSTNGTFKLGYELGTDTDLTILVNGVDAPVADDPGGLTRDEANADPESARDLNVRLDAGEEVRQGRIGLVLDHRGSITDVQAYAYALQRDFENRLPVPAAQGAGIVHFDRFSPGAGLRMQRRVTVLGFTQELTLGSDLQYQDDDRARFANIDGERGRLLLRQRERVTATGVYGRDSVALGDRAEVFAGVRFDVFRFDVDVHKDANGDAIAGNRILRAWSPSAGASYRPSANTTLFASVSSAFQTPTTTELADPDRGGFNPDLKPQQSLGGELGGRYESAGASLGATAFYLDVDDQIVRFESESGRDAYRNAGRSRRFGLELNGRWRCVRSVTWTGALTWIDTRFRRYSTDEGDFAGNREPGTPEWQVFQELRWQHPGGTFVAADLFAIGDVFVDDANRVRSDGYALVGARAGREFVVGRWTLSPFVALTNLLDERYDGTVRLNALGGRYFEPGPGRAFVVGMGVAAEL